MDKTPAVATPPGPVRAAIRWAFLLPVRLYQRFISPLLPAMCRYHPSCSRYMIEAVEKRGIIVGTLKGVWRICRCQPLCRGGWDPVDPDEPPPWNRADSLE